MTEQIARKAVAREVAKQITEDIPADQLEQIAQAMTELFQAKMLLQRRITNAADKAIKTLKSDE